MFVHLTLKFSRCYLMLRWSSNLCMFQKFPLTLRRRKPSRLKSLRRYPLRVCRIALDYRRSRDRYHLKRNGMCTQRWRYRNEPSKIRISRTCYRLVLQFHLLNNICSSGFSRCIEFVLLQLLMFSMCVMFLKASVGTGCTSHILTVKSLAKWVRAEFNIFKLFLKTILDEKAARKWWRDTYKQTEVSSLPHPIHRPPVA